MALDHFVPQVHLKRFYSPALTNRMYAIRKADLKTFTPDAKSVCRLPEGNTNDYLKVPRAIEDCLRTVEPKYNAAVETLAAGTRDADAMRVVAGFIASVIACSPAGMRLGSGALSPITQSAAIIADAMGKLPPPPPEMGFSSLREGFDSGKLQLSIDPKFPQAIGVDSFDALVDGFVAADWDILLNTHADRPFFTSDFPITVEARKTSARLSRIVPLAPHVAVRISPAPSPPGAAQFRVLRLARKRVADINRLIVRCAETTVFLSDRYPWFEASVRRNATYRIEARSLSMDTPNGRLHLSRLFVTPRSRNA